MIHTSVQKHEATEIFDDLQRAIRKDERTWCWRVADALIATTISYGERGALTQTDARWVREELKRIFLGDGEPSMIASPSLSTGTARKHR